MSSFLILSQEPGTAKDIQAFATKMEAKFTLFDKCDVKGKNVSPVYAFLKEMSGKVNLLHVQCFRYIYVTMSLNSIRKLSIWVYFMTLISRHSIRFTVDHDLKIFLKINHAWQYICHLAWSIFSLLLRWPCNNFRSRCGISRSFLWLRMELMLHSILTTLRHCPYPKRSRN